MRFDVCEFIHEKDMMICTFFIRSSLLVGSIGRLFMCVVWSGEYFMMIDEKERKSFYFTLPPMKVGMEDGLVAFYWRMVFLPFLLAGWLAFFMFGPRSVRFGSVRFAFVSMDERTHGQANSYPFLFFSWLAAMVARRWGGGTVATGICSF